jgi:group I intron endonuclease
MHISPSDKYYIGITSLDPNKRFANGRGYKRSRYFYNAILKYGWENFQHIIIANNLSKQQACEMEIELIDKYNSNNPDFGYNQSSGGESGSKGTHFIMSDEHKDKIRKSHFGICPSEEIKRKISESKKGTVTNEETKEKLRVTSSKHRHSEESKQKISMAHKGKKKGYVSNTNFLDKSRAVNQYDMYGHFINNYPSAHEAARKLNIYQSSISRCCNDKEIFYKNFLWRYDNGDYSDISIDYDSISKMNKLIKNKQVKQFSLDGILLNTYNSLSEASKLTGFSKSGISKCCLGEFKQLKNYIWKYTDELKIGEGDIKDAS